MLRASFTPCILALALSACGGGRQAETEATPIRPAPQVPGQTAPTAAPRPAEWPGQLLVGEGSGPALYLSEAAQSPAIGYVSEGVVVRIMGAPVGDRIPVRIDGPLKARGWLAVPRLAARAQSRGRVSGTPTYLGPNDIVGLQGPGSAPGQVRVEVRPWLGVANAPDIGPFVGEFAAEELGAEVVDPEEVEGPTAGDAMQARPDQEIRVYDRPNGELIATIPALTPPLKLVVLRDRGEWKGVRVGVGPYLIGYVNAQLEPASQPPQAPDPVVGEVTALPVRIAREGERPLFHVREGARIRFDGRTVAIFAEAGYAREMNRYENTDEVDVFVAVDDDLAIRGMIRSEDLTPHPDSPATTAPAAPAAPEPEIDEFAD